MALLLAALIVIGLGPSAHAQSNGWAWVGGSQQSNLAPVYGTMKAFSASDTPGGQDGYFWNDPEGNLWLFGSTVVTPQGVQSYSGSVWEYDITSRQWAWMAGPESYVQSGVYGSLGIAAAGNLPSVRTGATTWTDSKGNLWLFGGEGWDSVGNKGYLNDFWEFNIATLMWTWIGGSDVLPICPSTNTCGTQGVYGQLGTPASSNIPTGRSNGAGWRDVNGNFWLMGGALYSIYLNGWEVQANDLWEYSLNSQQWTWVGGQNPALATCSLTSNCGPAGIYGSYQVSGSANVPGARSYSATWVDPSGRFWLFGGYGFDASDYLAHLNDTWMFDPSTHQWTWESGSSLAGTVFPGPPSICGTLQTPASGNVPGGREASTTWVDAHGNLWLYGGLGVDAAGSSGLMGDLWMFNPATLEWAWMGGSTYINVTLSYGELGVPTPSNTPGSRTGSAAWTDKTGNLWLYGGGYGNTATSGAGTYSDFWEYMPYSSGLPATGAPVFQPPAGTYSSLQSISVSSSTPGASVYIMTNGNSASLFTQPIDIDQDQTFQAVAIAPGYAASSAVTAIYTLDLPAPPAPTFSPAGGTYYGSQLVTISDGENYATIYYTTDGSTPTTSSTHYTSGFWVASSQTVQAVAVVSGGSISSVATAAYNIQPVPPNTWAYVGGTNTLAQTGNYGALGISVAQNYPGSRFAAASWLDSSGNTWIFGGKGFGASGSQGWMNDLWMYNPGSQIQDGIWTWMGGSNSVGQLGVYGTFGIGSTSNIPGARYGSVTWTDQSGNLWLFGGYGPLVTTDGTGPHGPLSYLNDLWRYDPGSGVWTWVSGSSTSNYYAGAAGYGQAGVYGNLGSPTAGSVPGGRQFAASWMDTSGNLWLFGGYGLDEAGYLVLLNDLWEFNPQTTQWIWMGGTPAVTRCYSVFGECGQTGVYGTMGTPSASNVPGGRSSAAAWTDKSGNFWLFGGIAIDSTVENGLANNDLWMYSPASNQWTWMSGSNTFQCPFNSYLGYNLCQSPSSTLGTLGVPASGNVPSGRADLVTWVDAVGNLWLFGKGAGGSNDIWVYQPKSGQWAWMGGDYTTSNCSVVFYVQVAIPLVSCDGNLGVFGPQYMYGVGDVPGSRSDAVGWTDKSGNFWLFSGSMYDLMTSQGGIEGPVNDLWQFRPSANSLPPAATPVFSLIPGTYTSGGPLTISNGMPTATIYYTTDGTIPTTSSTVYSGPINFNSSLQLRAIAVAPGYVSSGVAVADFTLLQQVPPAPTFSVAAGTYSVAQKVTLSDATPYSGAIYYTTDGSDPTSSGQLYTQPLSISTSENINAIEAIPGWAVYEGSATSYDGIATPGASLLSPIATAAYIINLPQAATPAFSVPSGIYASSQTVTISDTTPGATIYYTTNGSAPTTASAVYSGEIAVSTTETIQAIAVATNYASSAVASATYTINLPPPSFTLGATPSSLTVSSGGQGTVTLTITPQNGFNSTVSFACSGLPSGASCGFSPANVTPSATSATTALTITGETLASNRRRGPFLPKAIVLSSLILLGCRMRGSVRSACMIAIAVLGLGGITACGGGGSTGGGGGGTTPVTSTITVTATSGSIQKSTTISLTVD